MRIPPEVIRCALMLVMVLPTFALVAEEPIEHFEAKIRPLLLSKCADCHSGKTADADLDLTTQAGFQEGGNSGPLATSKSVEGSLLWERITTADEDLLMPPGDRLDQQEVADLRKWLEAGSPWPVDTQVANPAAAEEEHWAFQPVVRPAIPSLDSDWTKNSIDKLVLSKLQTLGLTPAPDAEPRVWLRRLYLSATGLPPSLERLAALEKAIEQGSVSEFRFTEVDRVLGSREAAERQARQWLDVARYADTSGDGTDTPIPEARYYRNWVIDAFHTDMPYDQFVIQQIAGDLLAQTQPDSPNAYRQTIATGFIALSRRFGNSKFADMHQIIDDTIDTIGKSTMGLSLGCARCHHHKFDPVTQEDYYSWYGYFESTQYPHAGTEHQKERSDLPPINVPEDRRAEFESAVAWAVNDKQNPADARMHLAGDPKRKGDRVPRGFLEFLGDASLDIPDGASGRLQFARRLASAENPLFARVMVNRIWKGYFGKGLVGSSNFGVQTPSPVQLPLLDYLASELVDSGWSTRHIHRLILHSRLFQISSQPVPENLAADESNELLASFPRVRMDAEKLRDSLLFVSGNLEAGDGGRHPFRPTEKLKYTQGRPFDEIFDHNHRSVYLMTPRLKKHPMMALFDGADANVTTSDRGESTVALQALFFMNSDFVSQQAHKLAERATELAVQQDNVPETLWRIVFSRSASTEETQAALRFLGECRDEQLAEGKSSSQAEHAAWMSIARTLLASNEFVYID